MYRSDFEAERASREKLHAEKEILKEENIQLHQINQQIQVNFFFFFVFIFIFLEVFTNKRLYITSVQDINKFTSIVYIYTYMFRMTCYVILYFLTYNVFTH